MLEEYFSDEGLILLLGGLASILGGKARDYPAYEGARLLVALFLDGLSYPVRHFSHLAGKLAGLVKESGGEVLTSCGAEEVLLQGEGSDATPIGLRLSDGSQVRSNVVVLDVDPRRAAGTLIPTSALGGYFLKEMERLEPSCSAFLLHLIFQEDLRMPDRVFLFPTKARRIRTGNTYLEVNAIILNKELRAMQGKKGCVLLARVNVPSNCYPAFEEDSRGAELGAELTALIKEEIGDVLPAVKKAVREFVTLPTHFTRLSSTDRGSAFGFAPLLDQWYFRRPGPRLPLPNTYLVGGWSRYGGGLEGAILSGVIVARELCGEHPYPDYISGPPSPDEESKTAPKGRGRRKGEKEKKPSRKERKRESMEAEAEEEEEEEDGED
jgi:phytoene dehydrogenase-like protein